MTGHIVNDTIDPGRPGVAVEGDRRSGLLRGRLGWTGAVVTDDLGAEAIASRYTQDEAVALALEAGNDLLLFANQTAYVAGPRRRASSRRSSTSSRPAGSRRPGSTQSIERLDVLAFGSAIE